MGGTKPSVDAADVAKRMAAKLAAGGCDYAIGGAIALGYWAEPRGTLDVDFTLFIAPNKPGECVWLLQELGCELSTSDALCSLNEHGFCVEQILRIQGASLDCDWVRERLTEIYGNRDPRISQWDDLVAERDTAPDG